MSAKCFDLAPEYDGPASDVAVSDADDDEEYECVDVVDDVVLVKFTEINWQLSPTVIAEFDADFAATFGVISVMLLPFIVDVLLEWCLFFNVSRRKRSFSCFISPS